VEPCGSQVYSSAASWCEVCTAPTVAGALVAVSCSRPMDLKYRACAAPVLAVFLFAFRDNFHFERDDADFLLRLTYYDSLVVYET
jgi:hypothetical protein